MGQPTGTVGTFDAEAAEATAAECLAWDGSRAARKSLEERISKLYLQGPGVRTPAVKAVSAVFAALTSGSPLTPGDFSSADTTRRSICRVFLDSETISPFLRYLELSDDELIAWVSLLDVDITPGEIVRRSVDDLFCSRPRSTWIPAADAIARLALAQPEWLCLLQEHWKKVGFSPTETNKPLVLAKSRGARVVGDGEFGEGRHPFRHGIYLALSYLAAAGPPANLPGLHARELVKAGPPTSWQGADISAFLMGVSRLYGRDEYRETIVEGLTKWVSKLDQDEQVDFALRKLWDQLAADQAPVAGTDAALVAMLGRLERLAWNLSNPLRLPERIMAWVETARWCVLRGDTGAEGRMRAEEPALARLIDVAMGRILDGSDIRQRLIAAIQVVFDEVRWNTTDTRARVVSLVELLLLVAPAPTGEVMRPIVQHPDVAATPWRFFVARAVGAGKADAAMSGPVSSAAGPDLVRVMAERKAEAGDFTRTMRLSEGHVLALAPLDTGTVPMLVAVQLERLLREAKPVAADGKGADGSSGRTVRAGHALLLWRFLRADPPTKTIKELRALIRGVPGCRTELDVLLETLCELDTLRDARTLAHNAAAAGAQDGPADDAAFLCAYARFVEQLGWYVNPPESRVSRIEHGPCADHHKSAGANGAPGGVVPEANASNETVFVPQLTRSERAPELALVLGHLAVTLAAGRQQAMRKLPRENLEWLSRVFTGADHDLAAGSITFAAAAPAAERKATQIEGGLLGLAGYFESPTESLRTVWGQFFHVAKQVVDAPGGPNLDLARKLTASLKDLEGVPVQFLPPERTLLVRELNRWAAYNDVWTNEARRAARQAVAAARRRAEFEDKVKQAIGGRSEEAVCLIINATTRENAWKDTPPNSIRGLHTFLLAVGNYAKADELKKQVESSEVKLTGSWSHLAPTLIGVASGPLMLFDQSPEWERVFEGGRMIPAMVLSSVAMLGSFAIIAKWALTDASTGTRFARTARLLRRGGRLWFLSGFIASVVCGILVGAYWGVKFEPEGWWPTLVKVIFWVSLSQFLGLFLGIIAAGQRMVGSK